MNEVEGSFANKLLSDRPANDSAGLRQKGIIGNYLHEQGFRPLGITESRLIATGGYESEKRKEETEEKFSHRRPAIQPLFFQPREQRPIQVQW